MAAGHDVVHLVGARALFRLRVGDWRVIFRRDGDTMMILRVLHRREAYR
jgi:mRNA-degrading endonuclease RelE of RelBE toxin-antitoxin system